jgi:hypothetical protein
MLTYLTFSRSPSLLTQSQSQSARSFHVVTRWDRPVHSNTFSHRRSRQRIHT